jgi:hypothetical protein
MRKREQNPFRALTQCFVLLPLLAISSWAQEANWTGPYKPCLNSGELKKTGHMTVGVRYDITDRVVIQQFHRAFDFWVKVLDADSHDEPSTSCAIAIVDATPEILLHNRAVVARAQLPDRLNFNGWIAVDPKASTYLSDAEAIAVWIHEIGHLLGLKHNPSPRSLMFYLDVDGSSKLDSADLCALDALHALRRVPMMALRPNPRTSLDSWRDAQHAVDANHHARDAGLALRLNDH